MPDNLMQSHEYDTMFRTEETLWWYLALRDMVGDLLRQHLAPGARVLDCGCGTGMNSAFLQSRGYQVVGAFDPWQHAVAYTRSRGIKRVARASVLRLPVKESSVDAVLLIDVLGILDEPDQVRALHEINRVLRPGGILIIHAAALEWLRSQHDVIVNWKRRFTRPELRSLLEEAFPGQDSILKLSYRMTTLLPAIALVKLLKRNEMAEEAQSDQDLTPSLLNAPLTTICKLENRLLQWTNLPVGSSLVAVVRKA